jgi:hypothetical protein
MPHIINDPKDLELYSEQYICMLYHLTNHTTFRSRNADEVFKKLGLDAFHDVTGTTDEIVQHLVELGRIRFGTNGRCYLAKRVKTGAMITVNNIFKDSSSAGISNSLLCSFNLTS